MLGSSYPLLDVFVSTLYLVLFIFWLILAYHVFYDLFRSRDLSGVAKTLWVLLILIFPLVGCLLYVLDPRWQDAPARGRRRLGLAEGVRGLHPSDRQHQGVER